MDADDIIEAFGGNRRLAADLGMVPSAISMWRSNGVPAARCLDLSRLAKSRGIPGITLEVLLLSSRRKATVARRAAS